MNRQMPILIHPTSLVQTQQIGQGTQIGAFSQVMKGVRIGRECRIADYCYLDVGVYLSDRVTIQPHHPWQDELLRATESMWDDQSNAKWVQRLRGIYLPHPTQGVQARSAFAVTRLQEGVHIGPRALIRAGCVIGAFALVNAEACVLNDVPAHALVSGNPARIVGWLCQCGRPLHFQPQLARCRNCDLWYTKQAHGIAPATF